MNRNTSLVLLAAFILTGCRDGRSAEFDIGHGENLLLFVPNGLRVSHWKNDDCVFFFSGTEINFTISVFNREEPRDAALRHWDFMRAGDSKMTAVEERRFGGVTAFVFSTAARDLTFVYGFRSFPGSQSNRTMGVAAYWPTARDRQMKPAFEKILREMSAKTAPSGN